MKCRHARDVAGEQRGDRSVDESVAIDLGDVAVVVGTGWRRGLRARDTGRPRNELLLHQAQGFEVLIELEFFGSGEAISQRLGLVVQVFEHLTFGSESRRRLRVGGASRSTAC